MSKKKNTPEMRKRYFHKYYLDNRQAYIARAKARYGKVRVAVTALINSAKDKPCADCGIQYPPYVMQFDHVRGVKRFGIAQRRNGSVSSKDLLDEIAKCEVVCANCHAERTHVTRARMSRYARDDKQLTLGL